MKKSRDLHLRKRLTELFRKLTDAKGEMDKDSSTLGKMAAFLAEWEVFKYSQESSDWPIDLSAYAKVVSVAALYIPAVANFMLGLTR